MFSSDALFSICMWAQVRTLVAKLIGVVFSIAAGVIAGKEGPFVHGGAIIGGGIGAMGSQWVQALPPSQLRVQKLSLLGRL
jgi:H+/Cl- antiporter ClcA